MILTKFMKVFQVKCVIKHLIHVCLDYTGLTDFKFKTKYDALKKQYDINSLTKTRNIIFKDDFAVLV